MNKPDNISQEFWDTLGPFQRGHLVDQEDMNNVEVHRVKVRLNELRDALVEILDWYNGDPDNLMEWSDCMRKARGLLDSPVSAPKIGLNADALQAAIEAYDDTMDMDVPKERLIGNAIKAYIGDLQTPSVDEDE